ncbi:MULTISPECIES: GGDEF domain-containing protein [unclassified Streptomyces]|uniref:GGDEF domain-containing protein n=1 Tax=unclassified Streptomyces TaxID=2593676 RepID=UPI0035DE229C
MDPVTQLRTRIGTRALLLTTAAVPLTGWAVHATALHRRLATTKRDPLTGLLRRDAYTHRARRLLARHGDTATMVMVDADHFKAINDRLGHAAGDTVLAAFGARLTAWAGPAAAVGRLGGDEFALVLDLSADRRVQRLEQLMRMLHTPVVLDDGQTVDVAASVGAATPNTVGSRDLTALQRAADAALYNGKHTGRAVLATAAHASVPSCNGRRLGRPGTAAWGRAA